MLRSEHTPILEPTSRASVNKCVPRLGTEITQRPILPIPPALSKANRLLAGVYRLGLDGFLTARVEDDRFLALSPLAHSLILPVAIGPAASSFERLRYGLLRLLLP